MKANVKKKLGMISGIFMAIVMLQSTLNVYASNIKTNKLVESQSLDGISSVKIDPELQKVMEKYETDKRISVWVWLKSIPSGNIDQMLLEEVGMDPAVYKDESRFAKEILPEIEKEVEKKSGMK